MYLFGWAVLPVSHLIAQKAQLSCWDLVIQLLPVVFSDIRLYLVTTFK